MCARCQALGWYGGYKGEDKWSDSQSSWSPESSGRELTSVHVTQIKALIQTESRAGKQSKGLSSRLLLEGKVYLK